MRSYRAAILPCAMACLVMVLAFVTVPLQASESKETIWELERAYWRYVQHNDLQAYLGLWHEDFLGWPSMNASPVGKDHITDWITSQTSKGLSFKFVDFKPAAIQITGDVAVACYWVRIKWVDKNGIGAERTLRITHTWMKTGQGWKIVGGMSMTEASAPTQ